MKHISVSYEDENYNVLKNILENVKHETGYDYSLIVAKALLEYYEKRRIVRENKLDK